MSRFLKKIAQRERERERERERDLERDLDAMGISLFQKSLRDMIAGMRSNRNAEVTPHIITTYTTLLTPTDKPKER